VPNFQETKNLLPLLGVEHDFLVIQPINFESKLWLQYVTEQSGTQEPAHDFTGVMKVEVSLMWNLIANATEDNTLEDDLRDWNLL